MRIELYQQDTLALNDSRLALFCHKLQRGTLVALPEYTLNPFFTILRTQKMSDTLAHSSAQLKLLENLASKHYIHFIAPIITKAKGTLYKQLVYISPESKKHIYYTQQRLIEYEYWDEAAYFGNPQPKSIKTPSIFMLGECKIAMLFGFEIHFDEIWCKLKAQGVDIVIMPCANTFDSANRWRELCKMRALLNGCAILRVNRVGSCKVDSEQWDFYGDSLIAMPDGTILDHLGDTQERLSITLTRAQITHIAKEWGFRKVFD